MHSDKLPITGPCPIDLDAMGFDRSATVAHCTHCTKDVTVLSNMTRDEARRFLRDNKGKKLCVSYARDAEGRIRFAPEPSLVPVTRLARRSPTPSVPAARLRARPVRAAGLVAALGITAAMAACTPHGEEPPRDVVVAVEQPTAKPEPQPERIVPEPDPVPMAGAAIIPDEVMMDGEMEVPDPDAIDVDAPCDKGPSAVPVSAAEPTKTARRERPGMQVL